MQTAISKVSLLIAVIRYALSALLSHTELGAFSSLLLSLMPTVPLHLDLDLDLPSGSGSSLPAWMEGRGGRTWAALPTASLCGSQTERCPCLLHAQLCVASPQLVSCQLWSGGSVANGSFPNGVNCTFVYERSSLHACLISIRNWCQGDCLWCWDEEPWLQVWTSDSAATWLSIFLLFVLFAKPFSSILSIPVSLFVEKIDRTDM